MHDLVELARDIARLETGSPAGVANIFGEVGMLAIVLAGGAARLLHTALNRAWYFFERYLEYKSRAQGGSFEAKDPPGPESRLRYAFMFLVLAVACPVSLAAIPT